MKLIYRIDTIMENIFCMNGGLGPKPRSFLIYQPNTINYGFSFF